MYETQEIISIAVSDLLTQVQRLAQEQYRMVQISCTQQQDNFYLDYAFDKDYKFYALRVTIPIKDAVLPSISREFFAAFLYENEIHDLFGIKFSDLVLDYGGNFYRIEKPAPFRTNPEEKKE